MNRRSFLTAAGLRQARRSCSCRARRQKRSSRSSSLPKFAAGRAARSRAHRRSGARAARRLRIPGLLYNGSYVPPLLRVRVGDTMRITFRNALLDDLSNLHYHGMSVSPRGKSDNVFVHVHPGGQFDYEVRIPAGGRQGPGSSGITRTRTESSRSRSWWDVGRSRGRRLGAAFSDARGLAGTLPAHQARRAGRKRNHLDQRPGRAVDADPPGEMQFWRIGNIGATAFLKFRIEGMPLYVLATDGHPLLRPRKLTELFLGPGERIDAIAIARNPANTP